MYSVCLLCKLASGLGAIWYRGSHKGATPVVRICVELLGVGSLREWRREQNSESGASEPLNIWPGGWGNNREQACKELLDSRVQR